MAVNKQAKREYICIQTYFQDEWLNTDYKSIGDIEKEAKKFGDGKVKKMYISSSWFEHDTYYYVDNMGHTCLFRGLTSMKKDYMKDNKTRTKTGNSILNYEYCEEPQNA
jgi:hypothetical protein